MAYIYTLTKENGKKVITKKEIKDEPIITFGFNESFANEIEAAAKKKNISPIQFVQTAVLKELGWMIYGNK